MAWEGERVENYVKDSVGPGKDLRSYLEKGDIVGYASICSLHLERVNSQKGNIVKTGCVSVGLTSEMLIAVLSLDIQVSKDTKYPLLNNLKSASFEYSFVLNLNPPLELRQ